MNISQYIKLERGNASSLAVALGISPSYLSQLAMPDANVSPARCVEIEKATNKQVSRKDLRPTDWQLIWPELVRKTFVRPDGRIVEDERKAERRAGGAA